MKRKPTPSSPGSDTTDVKIPLPATMLISPVFFFAALFGPECGMGQERTIRGTSICQNTVHYKVLCQEGCAYKVAVYCKNPNHYRTAWTCDRDATGVREINKLAVLAGRLCGLKFTGTNRFFASLGSPFMHRSTYYDHVGKLAQILTTIAEDCKSNSANRLRSILSLPGLPLVADITVCGDNTWLTRGQKSLQGVLSLLSAESGDVIDTYVSSSYCTICDTQINPSEHVCQRNHWLSAGSMEVSGMKAVFGRSVSRFGFRYSHLVRDGDSKAYDAVKATYAGMLVTTLSDKNHAFKALLKRLLAARLKGIVDGQKITGSGKVTEAFVRKLANYMQHSIRNIARDGGTISELRDAFWATFYHKSGVHKCCPKGEDTWCVQTAARLRKELPPLQTDFVAPKYMEPLKQVFVDVTENSYLERLLHEYTTGRNENFHSLIWNFCPKKNTASRVSVQIATNLATCVWNDGFLITVNSIYEALQIPLPDTIVEVAVYRDLVRVKQHFAREDNKNFRPTISEKTIETIAEHQGIPSVLKVPTTTQMFAKRRKMTEDYCSGGFDMDLD